MRSIKILLIVCILIVSTQVQSQVQYGGKPLSKKYHLSLDNISNILLSKPDNQEIDNSDTSGSFYLGPTRYVDVNVLTEGTRSIRDSDVIILYRVKSTGTNAMFIVFDKFILSNTTKVFFHYGDSIVKGCYKNLNVENIKEKKFSGPIISSDECVIEVDQKLHDTQNEIHISSVAHLMYAKFSNRHKKSESTNSSCNINVNCPEENSWCNQIRSVAMYLFQQGSGNYQCGGALINNYNQDFTQYFYTADHCANDGTDFSTAKFIFNYETNDCNDADFYVYDDYSVNGSELLSYCDVGSSDNALLKISETIPQQYNVYYSGFDVHRRYLGDNVHVIHHPFGEPKKITHGKIRVFVGPMWDVHWDDGALFDGSSGGPLFNDDNKRIIACVHGGYNYDCDSYLKHDLMGKLRSCFQFASMKYLLNYGIDGIGGLDPVRSCQDNVNLFGYFEDASLYRSAKPDILLQANLTVDISGVSESDFEPGANFNIQAGKKITLHPATKIYSGSKVHLYIASCVTTEDNCGFNYSDKTSASNIATGEDMTNEFDIMLYPNPSTDICHMVFTMSSSATASADLIDMTGRVVRPIMSGSYAQGPSRIDFSTADIAPGAYMVRYIDGNGNTANKSLVVSHGEK